MHKLHESHDQENLPTTTGHRVLGGVLLAATLVTGGIIAHEVVEELQQPWDFEAPYPLHDTIGDN